MVCAMFCYNDGFIGAWIADCASNKQKIICKLFIVCSSLVVVQVASSAKTCVPMKPLPRENELFPSGIPSSRSVGASPREVLRDALVSGRDGEVVVRRGDDVGRVYVIDGGVAWAIASGAAVRVEEIVRHA